MMATMYPYPDYAADFDDSGTEDPGDYFADGLGDDPSETEDYLIPDEAYSGDESPEPCVVGGGGS